MSRSERLFSPVVWLVIGIVLGAGGKTAWAAFVEPASATSTFSSGTLAPPTNPAAALAGCQLLAPRVSVTWTPTTSTWADGYEVFRSLTAGGPYILVSTVSGQSTSSYLDTNLSALTTYRYVLKATKAGWRSDATAEVSVTTGTC